ncbi:OsmC family protein [Nafulsella turpanensis]|uniref:OsmC family protein n=1 Tax=Nafulsella turpanensis TaxID=1265690 RepID=UPI000346DA6A|nr:OsmC family protein [Nafulsella turpanensis]
MKRTATSVWKGSGQEGQGTLDTQSGVFKNQPYSFRTRFKNEEGKEGTNPEELIAAAHAGCFNMALSVALGKSGYTPDELRTEAAVSLEKQGEGFAVTRSVLTLTAKVPNIKQDEFDKIAKGAKENCPISKLLNCTIELNSELK